jgi:glycosyltransferase involved in cell wall biosynthesis
MPISLALIDIAYAFKRAVEISSPLSALLAELQRMLSYPFMQNALLAGTIVALVAGVAGYFMVLRGESFAGHSLANIGFAGAAGAALLGVPVVTHLRFPDAPEAYRWFFRPPFSQAIFISESFRTDALREAPDVFAGKSTVVYDAVELPRMWGSAERLARRQELDLPPDQPVVAITGQVSEVKGIWEFVDAADRLRHTNAMFAVLGDDLRTQGALRRDMEAKVAALGLHDRFRFLGFRANAPELVQAFDIVAVPSRVEPFGLASLEAMAASRPVVASRVGGIPEVVRDNQDGILVPSCDPKSLADGISCLIDRPQQRITMGEHGRRRAEDVFGMRVHGEALRGVYDRVLTRTAFKSGEVA